MFANIMSARYDVYLLILSHVKYLYMCDIFHTNNLSIRTLLYTNFNDVCPLSFTCLNYFSICLIYIYTADVFIRLLFVDTFNSFLPLMFITLKNIYMYDTYYV